MVMFGLKNWKPSLQISFTSINKTSTLDLSEWLVGDGINDRKNECNANKNNKTEVFLDQSVSCFKVSWDWFAKSLVRFEKNPFII